jgi:guanosine-3',5'-bis(diphosphate) 3'-pyrophosphohydrolase
LEVKNRSYEELVELIKSSEHEYDLANIERAYKVAFEAHNGQLRKSGEPYIIHPVAVAYLLVEWGMDSQSIIAGLLHDVVEDTNLTIDEIRSLFGPEIALLIDGLTKIGKIPFSTKEEQQAENLRKMLIAMSEDIRVIIIKFADRIHNLSTLEYVSPQKQRDKALECLEVYAPIADRLGMRAVKEYMEDVSLRYLDPIAYTEILHDLESKGEDRNKFIQKTKQQIIDRLSPFVPNVYVEGRVKSINGIYRKMFVQGKTFDEIYDIFALRIIVDNITECYNVLGIIHDMFRPLPNRFKDYISTPKPNMYQSLHTTVIGSEGITFEVQIRTWEMHHTAEYGIAAHWKYKLGLHDDGKDDSLEKKLIWIRQMLDNQEGSNDVTDIVSSIKTDLVPEEVFVFTPKGDVINLPMGSNVIDFAYTIHSEVGNRMIGAKVDKRIVPLDYKVKTGEIIEIITSKDNTKGPNRDWLNFVRTSEARNKIRAWFKKEKRDDNIIEGKNLLDKEFKRNNIVLSDSLMHFMIDSIGKRYSCNTTDDFYAAIGYGGIQLWKVIPRIKDEYLRTSKGASPIISNQPITEAPPEAGKGKSTGVIIDDIDNCLIRFSNCCNPLPGDEIIGFVTRGFGVSIHKRNCINVPKDISKAAEPERWVRAHWAGEVKDTFKSTLTIVAVDREGLLADLTQQLSSMHLFIHSLNSREIKNTPNAAITITISINGVDHLNTIIDHLYKVGGVIRISRS